MDTALIVMSRIPVEGKTKTRLMDIFTGKQCAQLHMCFLKDIFSLCVELKKYMNIYLTYTSEDGPLDIISEIVPNYVESFPQQGENLGNRMANAIRYVKSKGYEKVILIGADIPHIQKEHILRAGEEINEKDICLGPTYDGGYYMVGVKELYDEIFEENIKWGNKSVLESTTDKINSLGLSYGLVSKMYDIDTKEDISLLLHEYGNKASNVRVYPENTLKFLKENNFEA